MSKCPKCSNRLNFWKTTSLSRLSNRMICKSCDVVLEANKSALSSFGVSSVAIFTIILRYGEDWFGVHFLIAFLLAILGFMAMAFWFFYNVKLRVSKNQDKSDLIYSYELKKRPDLPKNHTRTEYLKNMFYEKTDAELEHIAVDPGRVPEAQEAARQLLNERKNGT
ncbi:hypothetical protein WIW50_20695 [Flavobacteriaceae bacterium 3-367]